MSEVQEWGGRRAQEYTRRTLENKGTTCYLCGLPGADSADHELPRKLYPELTWDLDNLRPAHGSCNSSKGKKIIEGPASIVEDQQQFFRIH
jgi:5-methylcytosine-specific restriction endonuclease McrA